MSLKLLPMSLSLLILELETTQKKVESLEASISNLVEKFNVMQAEKSRELEGRNNDKEYNSCKVSKA